MGIIILSARNRARYNVTECLWADLPDWIKRDAERVDKGNLPTGKAVVCVCVCAYVCPCIFRRNFTCKFRTSTHMSVIAITNEDRTSASTSPVHGSAAVVWQPKVRLHSTPGNCKRVVKLELGEYIVWNSWLSRESKTYGCWRRPELKYVNSWLEEIGRKWTKRKNCI